MRPLLSLLVSGALLPAVARAEVFVDPARAEALIAEGAAVIDARGPGPWRDGHLPGAQPLAWTSLRDGHFRTGRLSDDPAALTEALRGLGVSGARPVLVAGAGAEGWGEEGRIFWTLEYLGHPEVYVLDGGVGAWVASGRPLSLEAEAPARGDFTPLPRPSLRAEQTEVEAAMGRQDAVIWDAREAREYQGLTPYGEARGGHIPGARHLWFAELMGPDGRLLPEPALRALLERHGITPDREVIVLCTGGVRSGFGYAVLRELGYPRVSHYDASMWEWAASSAPLATGMQP